jgi:tetratricopeptide (TPR) repeat protein
LQAISMPATVQSILAARIDRLAPEDKRLLQAAAVIGTDVPYALLHAIADLPNDALRLGLARLQAAEFVYEARLFPELEYSFKHALTHEVAYGGVLQERRQALHARIVESIERLYADRLVEQVDLLAHHSSRAGLGAKAVSYLHQAGERAVGRSANREALVFLEQALALLEKLPQTPENLSRALNIRVAIGTPLIALKGATSQEVEDSYLRGKELMDELEDQSRRFPIMWGLWYVRFTRGEHQQALPISEQLLAAAQESGDSGQLVEAHHSFWPLLTAMGDAKGALAHMDRGLALYDPDRHGFQSHVYAGHDPGACAHFHGAMARWMIGLADSAVASIRSARSLAERLQHPLTTVAAAWFEVWLRYQRGENDAALEAAERLMALAEPHGFKAWTDIAIVMRKAADPRAVSDDSLDKMRRQLELTGATASRRIFSLCLLAELYGQAGRAADGRSVLASISEAPRQGYGPEINRIEGELLLKSGPPDAAAAERLFRRAIDVAHNRGQLSLELRASLSLARLWQSERRNEEEAHRLVAGVYGKFIEGLNTADLRTAKALLSELEGRPAAAR